MKNHFKLVCILLVGIICVSFGQDRYDNYWILGGLDSAPFPYMGRAILNFNAGSPEYQVVNHKAYLFECNGMSNQQGRLQFYHDGCHLYNHGFEIMEGGRVLNPGYDHDRYCGSQNKYPYYPLRNGSITIPDPINADLYHLLHLSYNENLQIGLLYHSRIDMSLNGGLGKLIEKRIVSDQLSYTDGIQGIRHGNGRDWWIICKGHGNDSFYLHLWTPDGIKGPYRQKIGIVWDFRFTLNHAAFSPDGRWYSFCNAVSGVHLFRFDRCTGELSLHQQLRYPPVDSFFSPVGVCFSPDSKLLYVSSGLDLVQYSVDSSDIQASYQLVDSLDLSKSVSILPPVFYMMLIGPDGKIYMNTTNSTEVLHVIHKPNERGPACDFRQNDIKLPVLLYQNLPNFPHYRTYDWEGSVCDTLGITGPVNTSNPMEKKKSDHGVLLYYDQDRIKIHTTQQITSIQLYTTQGSLIMQHFTPGTDAELSVNHLPQGVYIIRVYFIDHSYSVVKFIQH